MLFLTITCIEINLINTYNQKGGAYENIEELMRENEELMRN